MEHGIFQQRLPPGGIVDNCYANALVITATVVIVAAALILIVPTMLFLITRNVLAVVPAVLHKVDPLAAGVVFVAVLAPISGMARRYAQIDRRTILCYPLDYSRLAIDHLRLRVVADVEPAIKSGLADADRDANVGSVCRGGDGGSGYCRCDQKIFHVYSPVVSGF